MNYVKISYYYIKLAILSLYTLIAIYKLKKKSERLDINVEKSRSCHDRILELSCKINNAERKNNRVNS